MVKLIQLIIWEKRNMKKKVILMSFILSICCSNAYSMQAVSKDPFVQKMQESRNVIAFTENLRDAMAEDRGGNQKRICDVLGAL
jgi:hypothetical protein